MSSLPKLLERLGELKQIPDAAVSYKDFQAPSEHDFGILRSLFSIKRDATALSFREDDRQFFSAFMETVSSLRETVLASNCKAHKISDGAICGAGLTRMIISGIAGRTRLEARGFALHCCSRPMSRHHP